jgi:hypothetical protein
MPRHPPLNLLRMNEINPYAPPRVTETESTSGAWWRCYGERVMARNGAMLPQVDLETGASGGEMTAVSRTHQGAKAGQVIRIVFLIVVYVYAKNRLNIQGSWPMWTVIGGSLAFSFLSRIRNKVGGPVTIWEYREAQRERRRQIRRRWRNGMLALSLCLMILGPWQVAPAYPMDLILLVCGAGLLGAHTIWSVMDRPKTRSESAPQGWLRIRNVHPEAMVKLRKIEAAEWAEFSSSAPHRPRKAFTTYYHKYPLRSLLGDGPKNPFIVFLVCMMKLLRSKRLERESFDFSEAREVREDELHGKLRERIGSWRSDHPDWKLILMDRLPSPAADLVIESALLVSPGLEHSISFHHSWLERKPTQGTSEFSFLTWLKDGKILCTTHMPLLPLERPDVDTVRARGAEEVVFQAHLDRCPTHEIDPAGSAEHLRERFRREKQDMNDFLEAAGLRGPTREAIG